MKYLILILMLFSLAVLNADAPFPKVKKELNSNSYVETNKISEEEKVIKIENDYEKIVFKRFEERIINEKHCNRIIDQWYYINCYDNTFKSSLITFYNLRHDLAALSVANQPLLKDDTVIKRIYQSQYKDYEQNLNYYVPCYLSNPDSLDHSTESKKSVYLASNAVPMLKNIKENQWKEVSNYELEQVKKYKELKVFFWCIV